MNASPFACSIDATTAATERAVEQPAIEQPASVVDAATMIRDAGSRVIIPIGGGTKWDAAHHALIKAAPAPLLLSTRQITGILEYDAGELTLTAHAGTPLAEVVEALATHGQYLPFDPMLASAGATLGGTVAAGLSGPRRLRYGGLRDFIIGIDYLNPVGAVIHSGGKVVKNAAGYDLSKLFCGARGSLGLLTTVSFKVFPAPQSSLTLFAGLADAPAMQQAFQALASSPAEVSAVEAWPATSPLSGIPAAVDSLSMPYRMAVLIEGAASSLESRAQAVARLLGNNISTNIVFERDPQVTAPFWDSLRDLTWIGSAATALRLYHAPAQVSAVERLLRDHAAAYVVTVGGNATWATYTGDPMQLQAALRQADVSAEVWRAPVPSLETIPIQSGSSMARRVKQAFDPNHRFYTPPSIAQARP